MSNHPLMGKAVNLGISTALDPNTYALGPAGAKTGAKVGKEVAEVAGEQLASFASGMSNVPIKAIKQLFQNPLEIFKAASTKESGELLQKAKAIAGVTREEEFLIAKAADRGVGGARTVGEQLRPIFEKTPEELSVGQLMALNRASGKLATEAAGSDRALWSGVKKAVSKALETKASKITEALDMYSKGKIKESFLSLFPKTKQGCGQII
jgi:hypothetical protein